MISYDYPSLFFRKKWVWFDQPHDVPGVDLVNFFSYECVSVPGFRQKKGLTSVIDLSQDEQVIWNGMRQSFIAKQIEKGRKNGIIVAESKDFRAFRPIYEAFRRSKKLPRDSYQAFAQNGILFTASIDGRIIAGGIFVADESNMRAWVLASLRLDSSNGRMREMVGQANRMVIWEAIRFAKSRGLKRFDLGGIDPDSADPAEKNLADFKEAFGGSRVPTCYYYKVYSPLLRSLMKLKRRFL
jgi:Acetyltransferase (GNAT) domain